MLFSFPYSVEAQDVHPMGIEGEVVYLNDLEDHSWSYYSDATCPIRSLNPADVTIIYYGNGQAENNMTTTDKADAPTSFGAKATGVKPSRQTLSTAASTAASTAVATSAKWMAVRRWYWNSPPPSGRIFPLPPLLPLLFSYLFATELSKT